jgi:hypothetical protein
MKATRKYTMYQCELKDVNDEQRYTYTWIEKGMAIVGVTLRHFNRVWKVNKVYNPPIDYSCLKTHHDVHELDNFKEWPSEA